MSTLSQSQVFQSQLNKNITKFKFMNYAPVLIPTLNRYEHFKRCVESLSQCIYANETDLIIALDYPLKTEHWDGYTKIKDYISSIVTFKSVTIIVRDINFGAYKNLFEAIDSVFEKYDRFILSEDDNVFSIDFLAFINKGLHVYEKRNDVFSISGYNYPIITPTNYQKDIYIWQGFSAWGVGLWKEKWQKVVWEKEVSLKIMKSFLNNYFKVYKYQKIANHYFLATIEMVKQDNLIGDGYISLHHFINNMYTVFPNISRVRNLGHDGSGINCGFMENDIYGLQDLYVGSLDSYNLPSDIKPNVEINKILSKHFKTSFKEKIKTVVKLIMLNNGIWYK
jgi:hypothetical protein